LKPTISSRIKKDISVVDLQDKAIERRSNFHNPLHVTPWSNNNVVVANDKNSDSANGTPILQ